MSCNLRTDVPLEWGKKPSMSFILFIFQSWWHSNLSCSRWRCHCSSPVVQQICKSLPLTSSWPCVYTYYCGAICHSRLRLLVSNRHHGSSLLEETYPSAGMPNSHPSKLNSIYVRSSMCRRCALIMMLPSDVGDAQTASRSLTSPNPKPNCVISIRFRWFRVTTHDNPSREFSWQEFFSTQTHQTLLTYLQGMKHDIRKKSLQPMYIIRNFAFNKYPDDSLLAGSASPTLIGM